MEKVKRIQLTDSYGRVLLESENANSVDLTDFPDGIYVLVIRDDGQFISSQMILKKSSH